MKDNMSFLSKVLDILRPGFHSRGSYWSHSKFSTWLKRINGVPSPTSMSMQGWNKHKSKYKADHPFLYWFNEKFVSGLQDIASYAPDKFDDVRSYFMNRFVDKSHVLNTRLKPGKYYEIDTRVMYAMFETLVDFVEIEKAWMMVVWSDAEVRAKYDYPKWYFRRNLKWFKRHRCPNAGLDHLNWEMGLIHEPEHFGPDGKNDPSYCMPTSQAESAKEQYELYMWWKNEYLKRPDINELSGWSEVCDKYEIFEEHSVDAQAEIDQAHKRLNALEVNWAAKDDEMLKRLIDVRRGLWT